MGNRFSPWEGPAATTSRVASWNRTIPCFSWNFMRWKPEEHHFGLTTDPGGRRNCQAQRNIWKHGGIWTGQVGRWIILLPIVRPPASRMSCFGKGQNRTSLRTSWKRCGSDAGSDTTSSDITMVTASSRNDLWCCISRSCGWNRARGTILHIVPLALFQTDKSGGATYNISAICTIQNRRKMMRHWQGKGFALPSVFFKKSEEKKHGGRKPLRCKALRAASFLSTHDIKKTADKSQRSFIIFSVFFLVKMTLLSSWCIININICHCGSMVDRSPLLYPLIRMPSKWEICVRITSVAPFI